MRRSLRERPGRHVRALTRGPRPRGARHLSILDSITKLHSFEAVRLKDPHLDRFGMLKYAEHNPRWPPGTYYVAQIFCRWFGPLSIWTTQLTNLSFSLLLLVGVIGLGAEELYRARPY
jgi:hypothetical protein